MGRQHWGRGARLSLLLPGNCPLLAATLSLQQTLPELSCHCGLSPRKKMPCLLAVWNMAPASHQLRILLQKLGQALVDGLGVVLLLDGWK